MAESLGLTTQNFNFDKLVGDNYPVTTEGATILSGETPTARGALVGKIAAGTVTQSAYVGTGDGTSTLPVKAQFVQVGDYKAICFQVVANNGYFNLFAPDGTQVGVVEVGSAFTGQHLTGFTISDGATDFVVGDIFTFTVAAGSGKYKKYSAASIDGSGNLANVNIVATTVDATSADVVTNVYTSGVFNSAALVGYVATMKGALGDKGIRIVTNEAL